MTYLSILLPDFVLILIGYLLCRFTSLNRPLWDQVERIVYYVLLPVLLFYAVARSPLDWLATGGLVGAGLILVVIGVSLSYAVGRLPGVTTTDFASSAQVGFRFNAYVALAMAERLGGQAGLLSLAVLIGVCIPLVNMAAVWPMSRHSKQGMVQALVKNPLIIGALCGLVFNGMGQHLPSTVEPVVSRMGQASLALGLMACGAGLQLGQVFNTASRLRCGVAVLGVRHLFLPLAAVALIPMIELDRTQSAVLLIFSALPAASSCYVLATRMGFDGAFVAGLLTLSTLLGMLSLPFALSFL